MNNCTFEIHHTNGEILADNLIFDDLPIIFQAYQEWYGEGSIIACYRTIDKPTRKLTDRQAERYREWYEYLAYCKYLDNI